MNPGFLLAHFNRISDAPGAIPRLRRFIIDLAVRGKLVEQRADEEPAAQLLRRIQVEKARLVKEGKIRKQNIQPDVEPKSIPFAIPKNWIWTRLGDVIHLVSGQHLQPGEYSEDKEDGLPYITGPADFGQNGLVITRRAMVRKAVATKGQILLTVKGAGVGKTALCDLPEVAISRQLMAMTAIEWSQKFLLLTTHRLAAVLIESARSLIPGISREDVDDFIFPLPPLPGQHRIVAKVDELMALCDRLEATQRERESRQDRLTAATLHHLNNGADPGAFREHAYFYVNHLPRLTTSLVHIQRLRQTILNLAVRGQLVPQEPTDEPASVLLKRIQAEKTRFIGEGKIKGHSELAPPIKEEDVPFSIPPGWQWARFIGVAAIQSNLVNPSKYEDWPHIAPDNIESGTGRLLPYITIRASAVFSAKHLFFGGCILYSKIRPALAKAVIVDFDGLCSADMYPILPFISREYLHKYMLSEAFVKQSVSEDNRVAMPKINQVSLSKIVVPVPPLAEQHRIVAKVTELMAVCDRLETQLTTTQNERHRLLEAVLHHALDDTLQSG